MKRLWLLTAVILAASCDKYDPAKYVIGPDTINGILNLLVEPSSVQADGLSTVVVTAIIDAQSSKREVVFTATDGTFTVGVQPDPKTAKVTADASGRAVTELRSSTTVGTVKLDASITVDPAQAALRRTVNVAFTVPTADSLLTLVSSAPTMPADGFSRVTITGTLKVTSGTTAQRQIQFTPPPPSEKELVAASKDAPRLVRRDGSRQGPKPADAQTPPAAVISYEERKRLEAEARKAKKVVDARRKRIDDLETRIAEREQAIRDIEATMAAPGFYDNRNEAKPIIDKHQALMWEVGDLMHQWEELQRTDL